MTEPFPALSLPPPALYRDASCSSSFRPVGVASRDRSSCSRSRRVFVDVIGNPDRMGTGIRRGRAHVAHKGGGSGLGGEREGRQRGAAWAWPDSSGEAPPVLLAVADLAPHPALFPAHLASSFAFPHRLNRPFLNAVIMHRANGGPRQGQEQVTRTRDHIAGGPQ